MKYLGIDYGDRNVGLALSDDEGQMAFPKETLLNTSVLDDDIVRIAQYEKVGAIVLGESTNFKGEENPIMKRIVVLKEKIEKRGMPVHFESELFSSQEASRGQEGYKEKRRKRCYNYFAELFR